MATRQVTEYRTDANGNRVLVSDTTEAVPAVQVNLDSVLAAARQALIDNRAYVALAPPTAAQTTAQVKALSRQVNGIIRLLLGQLDATD